MLDGEVFLLELKCHKCDCNFRCYGSKLAEPEPNVRQVREYLHAAWNRRAAPEPAPDDRERAKEFEGSLNAFSERKDVRERLAAEFARVRAEATKAERERCARVCERLQAGNNAEFDHANGRDAKRAALMLGLAEGAADCAAAIRKGEP